MDHGPSPYSGLDQASAAWTASVILEGHAECAHMVALCEGPALCFTEGKPPRNILQE